MDVRDGWADQVRRPAALRLGAAVLALVMAGAAIWVIRARATSDADLSTPEHQMIDVLESVLLHNTDVPQYALIADPHDGRGFVAGIGDFTTADGGIRDVVEEYGRLAPGNLITGGYLAQLRILAAQASPATDDLTGFADAWRTASATDAFAQAESAVMQRRYLNPALLLARQLGVTSPLGVAVLYDAVIEHGMGSDPDGLPALIGRVKARAGPSAAGDQRAWLEAFLEVRVDALTAPADAQHVVSWPGTVERARVLAALLRAGADDLKAPLKVTAYGTDWVLSAAPGPPRNAAPVPPVLSPIGATSDAPTSPPALTPTPSAGPTAGPTTRPTAAPPTPTRTTTKPPTTTPPPAPVRLSFANFASSSGLRLNGAAAVANQQLTLASGASEAGSAWANTRIDPTKSFTSSFEFDIADITDGLAFVIQSASATAIGTSGGGLGYGARPTDTTPRITPSLDVEFDTWDNSSDGFDPAGHQHVAVMTNGDVTNHLFWADPGFSMFRAPVFVWLTYNAGAHTLAVYASQANSRPGNPLFIASINLAGVVGSGPAFAGFTGGTGDVHAAESILNWTFEAS